MYKNESNKIVSVDQFQQLMSATKNHKRNVEGLLYEPSQAPQSQTDRKGWRKVIWGPHNDAVDQWHKHSLYKIQTQNDGIILVQYIKRDQVHDDIQKGVNYFLNNYGRVHNHKYEKGHMVGVGLRYDARTATVCSYPNIKDQNSDCSDLVEKKCFTAFNDLVRNKNLLKNPAMPDEHKKTIEELKKSHNILKIDKKDLLPTYAASESLHDSLHVDCDDASRCYVLKYQKEEGKGKSFLVFPKYSLAIHCSKVPVIISFLGKTQQHCTICVEDGMMGLFAGSKDSVGNFKELLHAFANPRKRCNIEPLDIGDEVWVEAHIYRDNLAAYDTIYNEQNKVNRSNNYVIRKAKVENVIGSSVHCTYVDENLKQLGSFKIDQSLVRPINKKAMNKKARKS